MPKHNRKKEEITDVVIEKMSSTGKGLFRKESGEVVFVNDTIPGDVVDIRIIKKKKAFSEATVLKLKENSQLRIEPVCEHFHLCGGCKWQSINYSQQLKYKEDQVYDALNRLGDLQGYSVNNIIPCEEELYYRNKLEYTFTPRRWFERSELRTEKELDPRGVGFHIPGNYDKVVDIRKCHLQPEPTNEIRNFIKEWARENDISFYSIKRSEGFLRNLIIRTSERGEVMVVIQIGQNDEENIERLIKAVSSSFPAISSLNYVINTKKNEIFHDLDIVCAYGKPYISEYMNSGDMKRQLEFRITPKSFYQTNSKQAEKLYKKVFEYANLKGDELVYDLYTGTGTIACFLAGSAKKVIGIEYVEQAVIDAKSNATLNSIENVEFTAGDMAKVLTPDFIKSKGKPDLIVADPPRAGMHKDVIQTIMDCNPEKIIYVSCNPSTQARDLQILSENYNVNIVQPVDMFPQTPHVENIVTLSAKK